MGLEQQIVQAVEQAVKEALKGLEKAQNGKSDDAQYISTDDAGLIYGCSGEYIRHIQNIGLLTLYTLPGSKHRRVLKSELLELMEKNVVKRVGKR